MKILNFKEIVAKVQSDGHDITETKLKEYLAQIIEAIGVNSLYLREDKGKKPVTLYSPYGIPEEDSKFFIWLLEMYTSENFQAIRSALFRNRFSFRSSSFSFRSRSVSSMELRSFCISGLCRHSLLNSPHHFLTLELETPYSSTRLLIERPSSKRRRTMFFLNCSS